MAQHEQVRAGARGRRRLCVALAPLVFGFLAAAAAADENSVRAQLKAEAAALLERGDLDSFDRRATQLRESRERTPAGIWKLSLFYRGVDELPTRTPDAPVWARVEQATAAYLRTHPQSPSAVVAAARVLVTRAWAYRGDGWGASLTEAQRDGFATWLERARAVLDEHREVGQQDPEWYALRIQVMNGQGEERVSILALAQEALGGEPTYQPTYYVTSNALLPKWGGSAQLLQQYVAAVLASSAPQEGRQAYARIAFNIARTDPQPVAALRQVGLEWPRVKQSLEEISAAYPDPWNTNAQRAMACLIGTESDFRASSAEAGTPAISVAWFDTLSRWQDCSQRQQQRSAALAGGFAGIAAATPSAYLLATTSAAVLLALGLLHWSRRRRANEEEAFAGSAGVPAGGGVVYPPTRLWMTNQLLAGLALLLMGLAGVWGFGAVAENLRDTLFGGALVFCSALLGTAGVMTAIDACVSKVVLYESTLAIVQLWSTRYVRREDLATRQTVRVPRAPAQLWLRFKDPSRRPVKLPMVFALDTSFQKWFESIPDVDAVAAAQLEAQVRSDPTLGQTPDERLARFARARLLAQRAAFVAPALFLWSSFYPHPYLLIIAVLLLLPWLFVALMARHPGLYDINGTASPGRPNLAAALIPAAIILALRAFRDVHILEWHGLLPWAIGTAVLLGVSIYSVNRTASRKWSTAFTILLVSAAYGFGAATSADAWLDRSAPAKFRPAVLGKHVSGGRYRSYDLLLAPWGPRAGAENVQVPPAVYSQAHVGQQICVSLRGGALGSNWYTVSDCSEQGAR
jgi:hypothetical protein